MSNLTRLFKVGQKVIYRNNDFDAVKRNIPCVVKETFPDHIIITDTETTTDLWIEEGLNMDCVYPEYNFQHQEKPNENYFEEMNDYLDGTMCI